MRDKANSNGARRHKLNIHVMVDFMNDAKTYFLNRKWNKLLHLLLRYAHHSLNTYRRIMLNYVILCLQHHPAIKNSGYLKKLIIEYFKFDDSLEKVLYDQFL